jgi:AcrR family transcriptional regulator
MPRQVPARAGRATGRKSPEHRAEVRARILAAAREAFATAGFRGTNVPDIAHRAGISVGLIYRYFASKEELFLELCLQGSSVAYQALATELERIDDPHARLRAALGAFLRAHQGSQGLLVLQALPAAAADARVAEALVRRREELVAFSAGFIRDAIARGEVADTLPVDSMALGVATLLDGAMVALAIPSAAPEPILEALVGLVAAVLGWEPPLLR